MKDFSTDFVVYIVYMKISLLTKYGRSVMNTRNSVNTCTALAATSETLLAVI
jgi:hypothetical protein